MKEYDLIVIGSGSGLNIVSRALNEKKGLKIAIIEKNKLGGTCLNEGCIPSKMLIEKAYEIEKSKNKDSKNFNKIISEVKNFIENESNRILSFYKNTKSADLYLEEASFVNENTLKVGNQIIKGKKIVLSIGAKPKILNIEGLNEFWTYKEALFPEKLPKHLVIIGGGYIGFEIGFFYAAMGAKVTILEKYKVLANIDDDIKKEFLKNFNKNIKIFENVEIRNVQSNKKLIFFKKNKKFTKLHFDKILVAAGIELNLGNLNLIKANVGLDKKGFIKVNGFLETSNKNIYSFGDAISSYYFKHSANFEADYVFDRLFNNKKLKIKYLSVPFAIFSCPIIAGCGKNEIFFKKNKISYFVKKAFFKDLFKANIENQNIGFIKMIFSKKDQKLLGAFIIGSRAPDLIHILSEFLNNNLNVEDIKKRIFIHPTFSEIILKAIWH